MKKKYISPAMRCTKFYSNGILAGSIPNTLNDDFDPDEVDDEQKDGEIIFGL